MSLGYSSLSLADGKFINTVKQRRTDLSWKCGSGLHLSDLCMSQTGQSKLTADYAVPRQLR